MVTPGQDDISEVFQFAPHAVGLAVWPIEFAVDRDDWNVNRRKIDLQRRAERRTRGRALGTGSGARRCGPFPQALEGCGGHAFRLGCLGVERGDLFAHGCVGLVDPRTAETGRNELLRIAREEAAGHAAAHGITMNMRLLDTKMVHQFEHIFGAAGAVRSRLVTLAVVSVIERHDAVVFSE